jgi:hypothetical protein
MTLQGCASTRSIEVRTPPPQLSKPDKKLLEDCLGPVRLAPDGILTQKKVEKLWIKDRESLINCGKKFKILKDFYKTRDRGLANE